MKTIPLTQGKVALVDDADYERVSQYKWTISPAGYAYGWCGGKKVYMHRFILEPKPRQYIDHKNGDRADNRRCNLRECTSSQNVANSRRLAQSTSVFKGVSWDNRRNTWCARIGVKGKGVHLGYFANEVDAARAYDAAALKYFGEFARPNFNPVTLPGQMSLI